MKKIKKKTILISSVIFLILIVIFGGYSFWSSKNKTVLSYTNQEGEEKSMIFLAIPGIEKQSEEITNCSHKVQYNIKISQLPPLEASAQIKEIIKPRMQAEGWIVKEENKKNGYWVVFFQRDEEKLTATTGANEDLPIVELLYEWPPCSE